MTVRSMTGFGAASREATGLSVRAEAKSVNNRGLSVNVRGPSALDAHAAAFEAVVKRHVVRGTVSVSLSIGRTRGAAPSRIARAVLVDYADQASAIAEELGLDPPSLGDLMRLPGVLEDAPAVAYADDEVTLVASAIDAACAEMVAMREREGATLEAELRSFADQIERFAGTVEARCPAAVAAQRDRLRERLAEILAPGQDVPEETVAREIAVLADRTDVAEEVQRLRSHVAQWRDALTQGGPVGRRLDFLAQELGRETNTIGSKAQDAEITRTVVDMKVVVERLKEQAANLE
jgi:uncharacterized protein (TIGR00255 family)